MKGHDSHGWPGALWRRCRGHLGAAPATSVAAELDPKVLSFRLPDQIKWRDPTGAAGTNQAALQGDPTEEGLYIVPDRFKPGNSASRTSRPTAASSPL